MKSDFLSMYVQLATARAIATGQRNAIFRFLKADMVKNTCFQIYIHCTCRSHSCQLSCNLTAMKKGISLWPLPQEGKFLGPSGGLGVCPIKKFGN